MLSSEEHAKARAEAIALVSFSVGPSGCWNWVRNTDVFGYGTLGVWTGKRTRMFRAHRLLYETLVGPIPDGLQIDHLCRVHGCVNPDHMEPVTNRENTLRGETLPARNAAKTECDRGHPLTGANLYMNRGKRYCRICRNATTGRYHSRQDRATVNAKQRARYLARADRMRAERDGSASRRAESDDSAKE